MKKIIAVTVWDSQDPLIKVYTIPYLKVVMQLYPSVTYLLQTFDKVETNLNLMPVNGINIIKAKFTKGVFSKMYQYFKTIKDLIKKAQHKDVVAIHAFCTPGALIGYIVSLFSRKPLIIDSLEPHAECMVELVHGNVHQFILNYYFFLKS